MENFKRIYNKQKLVQFFRNLAWAMMLFSSTSLAALDAKYFDQIDHIAFNGNVNGRGSVNFYGKKNIEAVIPKDSTAKVVKGSATQLPSGAWALKVRVEKLGSTSRLGARSANTTSEYWVRYAQGSSYMTLVDDKDRVTAQADDAARARINRDTPAAVIRPIGASDSRVVARPATPARPPFLIDSKPSTSAADSGHQPLVLKPEYLRPTTTGRYCATCGITNALRPFNIIQELEQKVQEATPEAEVDAMIAAYTESSQVAALTRIAGRERRTRGGGNCYSDVKDDLESAGLIRQSQIDHLGLAKSAFMAEAALEHQGFVDLTDNKAYTDKYGSDPTKAPCGAILVYRGGPRGHGHAETVVCEGNTRRYVSDYRSTRPISMAIGEDVDNLERYNLFTRGSDRNRLRELRGKRELTGIMIKDLRNTVPPTLARR